MRSGKKRLMIAALTVALLFSIVMAAPATAAQNRPILIISDYVTTPKEVAPGATFDLELTLKNEGRYRAGQLLLTLASGGASGANGSVGSGQTSSLSGAATPNSGATGSGASPVSVLDSGNVRYIGDIASGATQTVTFKLISSGNADPRAYNLVFGFEYVNAANGRDESARQSIGLPLIRDAGLRLTDLGIPKKIVIGKTFKVKGEVVNSGSFTVHGITVEAAGDEFEIVQAADFIGPLDGGDSDQFEIVADHRGFFELLFEVSQFARGYL